MKHVKKIVSFLLVMVMMLSMSLTGFAETGYSITVKNAQAGETYKIYKMMDLSVNEDNTAYSYTVTEAWNAFFSGDGAGAAYITSSNGYVTWKEEKKADAEMEAFGKAAAAYAKTKDHVGEQKPSADGSVAFTGLEPGYYLITSTNGTLAIVDTTPQNPDPAINEKNADATIDKQVQEDSTSAWGENNSAQIGDTVNFKVTINAKKGAKNYVMHDKMTAGLTFDPNSVVIEGLTKDTDYTVVTGELDGECTFHIEFTDTYLNKITGDTTLTVTYSAVLNENAVVEGNIVESKNDAQLTWGDASNTEWDQTVTRTYEFSVLKYKADDEKKNPLAGAEFQLKDTNGTVVKLVKVTDETQEGVSDIIYRVATNNDTNVVESFKTVSTGKIIIKGVDLDTYTLVEIKAPAGYNLLNESKKVEVKADTTVIVEVPNSSGMTLPSTGGMGTTIFYVAGSVLVLAAVILLITKKRMESKEN